MKNRRPVKVANDHLPTSQRIAESAERTAAGLPVGVISSRIAQPDHAGNRTRRRHNRDMLANNGALRQETAQAVTAMAENLDKFKLLPDPAEALAIVLVIHKGGNLLMSILEKVIQPLLNAQRHPGRSEGRTEGRTEERTQWRDWLDRKAQTKAEGKTFNEPPPDERK